MDGKIFNIFEQACFRNVLHITFLVFQVETYIPGHISNDFQSNSESLMAERFLPFMVDLVHRCSQQLHLLVFHLEILGYIPGLLNGLEYLGSGDFIGNNLSFKLLRKLFRFVKP